MSTVIAIAVVVASIGMLITYQLGYAAGRREGFDDGHRDGKKAGAVRAYAVGYDRGLHDREQQKKDSEEEEPSRPKLGCVVAILVVLVSWGGLAVSVILAAG